MADPPAAWVSPHEKPDLVEPGLYLGGTDSVSDRYGSRRDRRPRLTRLLLKHDFSNRASRLGWIILGIPEQERDTFDPVRQLLVVKEDPFDYRGNSTQKAQGCPASCTRPSRLWDTPSPFDRDQPDVPEHQEPSPVLQSQDPLALPSSPHLPGAPSVPSLGCRVPTAGAFSCHSK